MMKIMMTGGGTAGHAMVNKILIPILQRERDCQISYIGSHFGPERHLIEEMNTVTYYGISTGKLRRYFSWENSKDLFRVLKGIYDAYRILRKEQPNVIFSGGGFVSVPVVIAAGMQKIPVLIRETDYTVGLANKICIRFAKKVFVTFPDTAKQIRKIPCGYCGLIVRPELLEKNTGTEGQKNLPTILILGGSQGSSHINQLVWNNLNILTRRFEVVHICGRKKTNSEISSYPNYIQYEYVDDMGRLYAAADIVIARCGSNTISECLALRKKMVCIPLSGGCSRGEQLENAGYAVAHGSAVILREEEISINGLLQSIEEVSGKEENGETALKPDLLLLNCQKQVREIRAAALVDLKMKFTKCIRRGRGINWAELSPWEEQMYLEIAEIYEE